MVEAQEFLIVAVMAVAVAVVLVGNSERKMDTERRVIGCIAKTLDVSPEKITREMTKSDIAMDSMEEVELIFFLEDEFNIEIPDDVVRGLTTVDTLIVYIDTRMADQEQHYD